MAPKLLWNGLPLPPIFRSTPPPLKCLTCTLICKFYVNFQPPSQLFSILKSSYPLICKWGRGEGCSNCLNCFISMNCSFSKLFMSMPTGFLNKRCNYITLYLSCLVIKYSFVSKILEIY